MPDASVQTELEGDLAERKFKQGNTFETISGYAVTLLLEVLDYVEGRGALPGSEVLLWLGRNNIPVEKQPREPKELETAVMEQVRKERSLYLASLREGWDERNEGREWMQFYPRKKPSKVVSLTGF
ncbi:hypothetical protein C8R43DRAFT_1125398 [Mycena crocata]|nr:hypothetical protein C8R43DRAFT_1125398 [Mycena crocata]